MERTDPAILRLIFAVLTYAEAKNSASNPFVKGFGRVEQDSDLAYKNLVEAVNDCSGYYPEVEEMVENILTEISSEQQAEIANQ